jgi:ABC-type Zn uptake system ZnuABC Zn-binding protein ZnuA
MQPRPLRKNLDRQILATQRRLVKAMAERLGTMRVDTKERYFAVLSVLVAKLEASDKSMRDIMQEMMGEAATMILQELQG